jgi:P-type Cu2+ transporter
MTNTSECKLCALPVPTPPVEDDGHQFCCFGCKEVYRNFGPGVFAADARGPATSAQPLQDGKEAYLRVDGMHCSSCEILINRLAEQIDGIAFAQSSYATSTAKVIYDPNVISEEDLPAALGTTGYRARFSTEDAPPYDYRMDLLRLVTGVALAGLVMMIYIALYYPVHLGAVDAAELAPIGWLVERVAPWAMFIFVTILVVYVAAPIFRGAWVGLRARVWNMDNLLAIAILSAYGYSFGNLLSGSLDLYFDVAATIIAVVTIGRYIERNAKIDATRELSEILDKWAPKARTRWGGGFRMLDIAELEPGEHVIIREREPVPVDGIIIYGTAAVDESLMTGEPFPISREPGEQVLGGSVIVEGELEIRVGELVESQIDNLARVLWNVQSSSAGAFGLADRVARFFVPLVLFLAAGVTAFSYLYSGDLGTAVLTGLATLIVSCPCTFGLAIPLTTAAGLSRALRQGIIFTSADVFEKIRSIDIAVLDKTGTLSTGNMEVTDVIGAPEVAANAAAVERLSPHPIARAIARLDISMTGSKLESFAGKGAVAQVAGRRVAVGGQGLFAYLGWEPSAPLGEQLASVSSSDDVMSYVGWDGEVHGAILTRDASRPEWKRVVDRLRESCRVVLLTGAEHPSGFEDHVDTVFAGVPPEGKAAVIRQLQKEGTVVMVGDGSNDAPALAAADLGIAFGAPSTLAAEAADVVIPGNSLERIFNAFDLVFTIRRRVRQNLGWALVYNAVAIPLAISGSLNPLFAAVAMSASSLMVVINSSRSMGTAQSVAPVAWRPAYLAEHE